jgi:hypothetical protein
MARQGDGATVQLSPKQARILMGRGYFDGLSAGERGIRGSFLFSLAQASIPPLWRAKIVAGFRGIAEVCGLVPQKILSNLVASGGDWR